MEKEKGKVEEGEKTAVEEKKLCEDEQEIVDMFNRLLVIVTETGDRKSDTVEKRERDGSSKHSETRPEGDERKRGKIKHTSREGKAHRVSNRSEVLLAARNTPIYPCICEKFIGSRLDGLIRHRQIKTRKGSQSKDAKSNVFEDDHAVHNMTIVLATMEQELFQMDLSHIDATRIVNGVWEDNKNVIELLFCYANRKTKSKVDGAVTVKEKVHPDKNARNVTSDSNESSCAPEFSTGVKPSKPQKNIRPSWKPSTSGKMSPSFSSYTLSTQVKKVPPSTAEISAKKTTEPKSIENKSVNEGDEHQELGITVEAKKIDSEVETDKNSHRTTNVLSKNKLIRLNPRKKGLKQKSDVGVLRPAQISKADKPSDEYYGSASFNDNLGAVVVPLENNFDRETSNKAAKKKVTAVNANRNVSVNPNDDSIASIFSLLNNSFTNVDLSTIYDADNYLQNLTQNSNVVSKITHLIKLSQAQRKRVDENEALSAIDVPLKYQNELSRLSKASSMRKKIWIKDRMIDNKVQIMKKKRHDQVVKRNKNHQKRVDEILSRKFIEELESRKR